MIFWGQFRLIKFFDDGSKGKFGRFEEKEYKDRITNIEYGHLLTSVVLITRAIVIIKN